MKVQVWVLSFTKKAGLRSPASFCFVPSNTSEDVSKKKETRPSTQPGSTTDSQHEIGKKRADHYAADQGEMDVCTGCGKVRKTRIHRRPLDVEAGPGHRSYWAVWDDKRHEQRGLHAKDRYGAGVEKVLEIRVEHERVFPKHPGCPHPEGAADEGVGSIEAKTDQRAETDGTRIIPVLRDHWCDR